MNDIILFILILLGIVFHEFGHFIYLWIATKKYPKINFVWYGVAIGDRNLMNELTLKQYVFMMISGIALGMPFFIWNSVEIFLMYLLISSFDFSMIISICNTIKEYKLSWKTKIIDIPCERCKRIKDSKGKKHGTI